MAHISLLWYDKLHKPISLKIKRKFGAHKPQSNKLKRPLEEATLFVREVSGRILAITSSYELGFRRFKRPLEEDEKIYNLVKKAS